MATVSGWKQLRHWPAGSHTPFFASYGWQVSSGSGECTMWLWIAHASPPWQPEGGFFFSGSSSACTQFIAAWRESMMSGNWPSRATLMRSLSAAIVPWIQQLPQYVGMCWFTSAVTRLRPLTLRQSKEAGMAASESDGSAERTSGGGRTAARWWPWLRPDGASDIHMIITAAREAKQRTAGVEPGLCDITGSRGANRARLASIRKRTPATLRLSLMSVYKQGDRERDPPKQEKKKDFFDEVGEEFDKLGNKFAKMQPSLVEKRAGEG